MVRKRFPQKRRLPMARTFFSPSLLAILLASSSALAQTPGHWELLAQTECVAGHTQAGNAILDQLFADTHDARFLRAQGLCLQVGNRWVEAADKFRAFLRQSQGLSAADLSSAEEQIRICEEMASGQGNWQSAALVSPAAPPAPPADRPSEELQPTSLPSVPVAVLPAPPAGRPSETPQPTFPHSVPAAVLQTTVVAPQQADAAPSECTKCYPGGLSLVPAADIPMAGIGAGVVNDSQFVSSGGSSHSLFLTAPYVELGAPGFRNLSLHYHAILAGWVATGGGQSQYDAVVMQHTAGLKIVPYYNGQGDSFLVTLNASVKNASATKTSGYDTVGPHGLLLYSGFAEPLVFKLGIGGGADLAITRGLRNSGQAQYFGQIGGLLLKRDAAYSYLVAELVGTVDLRLKDTVDYRNSRSSGSYTTRTNTTLDATHNMDVFFGLIVRGSAYQFKFGMDLPVTKKDQRIDYALVMGVGCLL
jgi:hypothetical protein